MNIEILKSINKIIRADSVLGSTSARIFKKPQLLITPSNNEEYPFMWMTNSTTEVQSYQDDETPELMLMTFSVVILSSHNDWRTCDLVARRLITILNRKIDDVNSNLTSTNVVNILVTADNTDYSDAEANAVLTFNIIYEDISTPGTPVS